MVAGQEEAYPYVACRPLTEWSGGSGTHIHLCRIHVYTAAPWKSPSRRPHLLVAVHQRLQQRLHVRLDHTRSQRPRAAPAAAARCSGGAQLGRLRLSLQAALRQGGAGDVVLRRDKAAWPRPASRWRAASCVRTLAAAVYECLQVAARRVVKHQHERGLLEA